MSDDPPQPTTHATLVSHAILAGIGALALVVAWMLASTRSAAAPFAAFLGAACLLPLTDTLLLRYGRSPTPGRRDIVVEAAIAAGLIVGAVALPGPTGALVLLPVAAAAWLVLPPTQRREVAGGGCATFAAALFALIAIAVVFVQPRLFLVREKANRSNCKGNQKCLGLDLILYRDNQGLAVNYPAFDGSDFLIQLYVVQNTSEPDLYLCPSSGDTNRDGADIRLGNTLACSYAGRRNRVQTSYPGLFTAKGASETAMTSDDSEGTRLFNHGDACIVLFADGHVEEISTDDSRLRGVTRVGQPGSLLHPLAN